MIVIETSAEREIFRLWFSIDRSVSLQRSCVYQEKLCEILGWILQSSFRSMLNDTEKLSFRFAHNFWDTLYLRKMWSIIETVFLKIRHRFFTDYKNGIYSKYFKRMRRYVGKLQLLHPRTVNESSAMRYLLIKVDKKIKRKIVQSL